MINLSLTLTAYPMQFNYSAIQYTLHIRSLVCIWKRGFVLQLTLSWRPEQTIELNYTILGDATVLCLGYAGERIGLRLSCLCHLVQSLLLRILSFGFRSLVPFFCIGCFVMRVFESTFEFRKLRKGKFPIFLVDPCPENRLTVISLHADFSRNSIISQFITS